MAAVMIMSPPSPPTTPPWLLTVAILQPNHLQHHRQQWHQHHQPQQQQQQRHHKLDLCRRGYLTELRQLVVTWPHRVDLFGHLLLQASQVTPVAAVVKNLILCSCNNLTRDAGQTFRRTQAWMPTLWKRQCGHAATRWHLQRSDNEDERRSATIPVSSPTPIPASALFWWAA